jgi:hypothetical protein
MAKDGMVGAHGCVVDQKVENAGLGEGEGSVAVSAP